MGAIGGLFSGAIAFYVNIEAGYSAALVPALKQFFYGVFVGGSLVQLSQKISISIEQKALAIIIGTIAPVVLTVVLISSIHLFKGTPNPLETIFFTALPTPFGFFIIATARRRKFDRKQRKREEKQQLA